MSGIKVSIEKFRVYFSNNTTFDIRDEVCHKLGMEATDDFGIFGGAHYK